MSVVLNISDSISVEPDLFDLEVNIEGVGETSSQAYDLCADCVSKLSKVVESMGYDKYLSTSDIQISPNMKYTTKSRGNDEVGSFEQFGFKSYVNLHIKTFIANVDLSTLYAELIKADSAIGINISFDVSKRDEYMDKLLINMISKARSRAELIMSQFEGNTLGGLRYVKKSEHRFAESMCMSLDFAEGDTIINQRKVIDFNSIEKIVLSDSIEVAFYVK